MRVLVHEYLTGGGMLDEPQFAALAPEGEAMVRALVDDLAAIPGIEVEVMRDFRLGADLPATVRRVGLGEFDRVFAQAVDECDAVWPIAPETDGILLRYVGDIRARGRACLASTYETIAIASSKKDTASVLADAGVPVVPSFHGIEEMVDGVQVVAKPDDGAGCQDTRLFGDRLELVSWLQGRSTPGLVLQPFVAGDARSLSAVFCRGEARLLACNRQQVVHADGYFRFDGVIVDAVQDRNGRYAALARDVAAALPGLWGFCGIDFIETDAGPVVLEINPRLTTSYAGLRAAIGVNPAQLVLDLPASDGR